MNATDYFYDDQVRPDILRLVPSDGRVIGSIGCGTAASEYELARQGREIHGVDVHAPSIEVAKTRLASARVVWPDDRRLFAPESLDGLILADVIEHLPFAWDRLKEYAGYLKPGGWAAISVPNMRNVHGIRQLVWRGDWPEEPQGIFDRTHLQFMTAKRLDRWCRDAGLPVEKWFDCYPPTTPFRLALFKAFDYATIKSFHTWLMYQLQVRCRKPA